MQNKTISLSIALLLTAFLRVHTAGANPALIVAGQQLNLPESGNINIVMSAKPGTPTEQMLNLFEYGTSVANYDEERWDISLPENIVDGQVLHDESENLLYLSYRYARGTLILFR